MRMRVGESRNSRSRLTANSHQLSCTLINFELVEILMRVNERFGSFDRSWELHESRRELQKQAISKSLPIRRRRKKENIITYHWQWQLQSDSCSNDSNCQQFDKRQKTKKKKPEKRKDSRQTSCNSHCSFDWAMRVEETLMQTLACQLSSTLILVWPRLKRENKCFSYQAIKEWNDIDLSIRNSENVFKFRNNFFTNMYIIVFLSFYS